MSKCKELYVMHHTEIVPHKKFFVLLLKANTTLYDLVKDDNHKLLGLEYLRFGCNLALAIEDCHANNICRLSMALENIFLDNNNLVRLHCFQPSILFNNGEENLPPYEYYSRK